MLGDKPLRSDSKKQVLSEVDSIVVTLEVALGSSFTDTDSLVVRGVGYGSSDEAYNAGRLWRQYLAMAFGKGHVGADLDPLPYPGRGVRDRPADSAAPGLVVYPATDFRFESLARAEVLRPIEHFLTDLARVREWAPEGFSERPDLELALRMFHISLMVSNVDAQYILLVSAVEALIPDERPLKADAKFVTAMNELTEIVREPNRFDGDVRDKILNAFKSAKHESIGALGAAIARKCIGTTYDGLQPDVYFRRVYGLRSSLVHGGLDGDGPVGRQKVSDGLQVLRGFVLDLVIAETELTLPR